MSPPAHARQPRPLTRATIFTRALAIVDAEGMEALTMRRLAADLGVKAPSLYNHVRDKGELLDGALRIMRAEFHPPSTPSEHWKELMAEIFVEYRRVLAAHPHMMPLAGRRLPGESESGLDFLMSLGFDGDEAVEIWQSLLALSVGFTLFSSGNVETDTRGLSIALSDRSAEWRDETFRKALAALMDPYDAPRTISD